MTSLNQIAQSIVADHKGILAADESTPTIGKRFANIDVENTEDNRRAYRELLFTTGGAADCIGGVILYDETLRQSAADGTRFADMLTASGIHPGIKVDMGAKPLAGAAGETVTEGLDGLRDRLSEYASLGAKFAKWRAVITIGDGMPSDYCLDTNAHALARYAALCQEAGLVPIVEPEVIMDGDHTLEDCMNATRRAHAAQFAALETQRVQLDGILLKPNMIVAGTTCPDQPTTEEVADATVALMCESVPSEVPGIVFLSGGLSEQAATANLSAMNARHTDLPWTLSFSYGRALQASCLKAWGGDTANTDAGREAYAHRAKMNSLACAGTYAPDMETATA
jgi:fructose-bisphosphate aldolase class I